MCIFIQREKAREREASRLQMSWRGVNMRLITSLTDMGWMCVRLHIAITRVAERKRMKLFNTWLQRFRRFMYCGQGWNSNGNKTSPNMSNIHWSKLSVFNYHGCRNSFSFQSHVSWTSSLSRCRSLIGHRNVKLLDQTVIKLTGATYRQTGASCAHLVYKLRHLQNTQGKNLDLSLWWTAATVSAAAAAARSLLDPIWWLLDVTAVSRQKNKERNQSAVDD